MNREADRTESVPVKPRPKSDARTASFLGAALAEHPFLKDLGRRHCGRLGRHAARVHFKRGDFLFHEGESADVFYLILEGQVAVETFPDGRGPLTIQLVQGGEALGWSCLIPPHAWRFAARAVGAVAAIAVEGEFLRAYCERERDFGYEMFKRLGFVIAQRTELARLHLVSIARTLS